MAKREKTKRTTTSEQPGVFYNRWTLKWHAEIFIDGKRRRLGMFKTVEQAIAARQAAERERDGLDLL